MCAGHSRLCYRQSMRRKLRPLLSPMHTHCDREEKIGSHGCSFWLSPCPNWNSMWICGGRRAFGMQLRLSGSSPSLQSWSVLRNEQLSMPVPRSGPEEPVHPAGHAVGPGELHVHVSHGHVESLFDRIHLWLFKHVSMRAHQHDRVHGALGGGDCALDLYHGFSGGGLFYVQKQKWLVSIEKQKKHDCCNFAKRKQIWFGRWKDWCFPWQFVNGFGDNMFALKMQLEFILHILLIKHMAYEVWMENLEKNLLAKKILVFKGLSRSDFQVLKY